ncbi:hypothetical protein XHV734_4605 [Xanthomonas hortorum pv. vitians]|nr:hypothetical protein XHV734_4605 [Xanthomonas hortorum pv. vitians]
MPWPKRSPRSRRCRREIIPSAARRSASAASRVNPPGATIDDGVQLRMARSKAMHIAEKGSGSGALAG